MKIVGILVILASIVSCGKIDSVGAGRLGGSMNMTQVALTTKDVTALKKICDSFARKTSAIAADLSANYNFELSQRACDESALSEAVTVETIIEQNGDVYKFRRTDNGSYFTFSDVETTESGVMKDICGTIDNPVTPFVNSAGVAISFDVVDVPGCPSGVGECIKIQKAIITSNSKTKYEIVTEELMKFQTDISLPKYGFYTYRSIESNTSCSDGKSSEAKASLK